MDSRGRPAWHGRPALCASLQNDIGFDGRIAPGVPGFFARGCAEWLFSLLSSCAVPKESQLRLIVTWNDVGLWLVVGF